MAATEYALTKADWTDCGAADDCTLQTDGLSTVVFTTATAKPAIGSTAGLRIGVGTGLHRDAVVKKPGLKLWARSLRTPTTLTVER